MNIFFLAHTAVENAQAHCDKHVVKMILETAQLLCTAHRELDGVDNLDGVELYKSTHKNHPSAVWVRANGYHYSYTAFLLTMLGQEYQYRYGKVHKTIEKLERVLQQRPKNIDKNPENACMEPPQCMPDEYKRDDTVEAYRAYYIGAKSSIAKWTKREPPEWWPK